MARIRRIAWRPFRIPFQEEFRAAHGLMAAHDAFVVTVEDNVGRRGLGEAPLAPFAGAGDAGVVEQALQAAARAAVRWQTSAATGGADAGRGSLFGKARLDRFAVVVASIAENAVRCAALDCLGRARGAPARDVLAGPGHWNLDERPGDAVPVNGLVGVVEPGQAAAEASKLAAAGFATIKIKLSRDAAADEARIEAVRNAVGPEVRLRFDANGAWTADEAKARLPALAVHKPEFVEQPIAPGPGFLATLRELGELGLLLAPDESVIAGEVWATMEDGMVADEGGERLRCPVVVKPTLVNLDTAIELTLESSEEAPAIVTTAFDSGIGTALALQLACLLPAPRRACGLDTLRFLEGDIVSGVPPIVGGTITLPGRPGLGVELDDEALERYATGSWREARA